MKFLLILFFSMCLFGCCDNVSFTKEDLKNNLWLTVFTPEVKQLEGVHNIDNNYLRISFKSQLPKTKYFDYVDSSAVKQGWVISYRTDIDRVYVKEDGEDVMVNKLKYSKSGWILMVLP